MEAQRLLENSPKKSLQKVVLSDILVEHIKEVRTHGLTEAATTGQLCLSCHGSLFPGFGTVPHMCVCVYGHIHMYCAALSVSSGAADYIGSRGVTLAPDSAERGSSLCCLPWVLIECSQHPKAMLGRAWELSCMSKTWVLLLTQIPQEILKSALQ
jgi:hypothetical protein